MRGRNQRMKEVKRSKKERNNQRGISNEKEKK